MSVGSKTSSPVLYEGRPLMIPTKLPTNGRCVPLKDGSVLNLPSSRTSWSASAKMEYLDPSGNLLWSRSGTSFDDLGGALTSYGSVGTVTVTGAFIYFTITSSNAGHTGYSNDFLIYKLDRFTGETLKCTPSDIQASYNTTELYNGGINEVEQPILTLGDDESFFYTVTTEGGRKGAALVAISASDGQVKGIYSTNTKNAASSSTTNAAVAPIYVSRTGNFAVFRNQGVDVLSILVRDKGYIHIPKLTACFESDLDNDDFITSEYFGSTQGLYRLCYEHGYAFHKVDWGTNASSVPRSAMYSYLADSLEEFYVDLIKSYSGYDVPLAPWLPTDSTDRALVNSISFQGSEGSSMFIEEVTGTPLTTFGSAAVSTDTPPPGYSSYAKLLTGSYLSMPATAWGFNQLDEDYSDWTMEFWLRAPDATTSGLFIFNTDLVSSRVPVSFGMGSNGNPGLNGTVWSSGSFRAGAWQYGAYRSSSAQTNIQNNVWHKITIVRNLLRLQIHVDGKPVCSYSTSGLTEVKGPCIRSELASHIFYWGRKWDSAGAAREFHICDYKMYKSAIFPEAP